MSDPTTTTASVESTASPFKLSANQCSSCAVSFATPEARRAHAKSEWHTINLRRRVAGLDPLDPPAEPAPAPEKAPSSTGSETEQEAASDPESQEGSDEDTPPPFEAETCLFCPHVADDFDQNVEHMHRKHGLFIPDRERLAVDLETLVQYLHLVIFGYRECIYCHSHRHGVEAVQQHMRGKGHCKFDLAKEDSEYLDFYHSEEEADDDQSGSDIEEEGQEPAVKTKSGKARSGGSLLSEVDDKSARLPSGRILSHRSVPRTTHRTRQTKALALKSADETEPTQPDNSTGDKTDAQPASMSKALTKSEKRENAITMQLAHLSVKDRAALSHLTLVEQRAVVANQRKEADRVRRAERRIRSRTELMGNSNLMHHFISDVPGPKNG